MEHILKGLSKSEVEQRLAKWGHNEVVPSGASKFIKNLKTIILDPMGLMLLGLSALYFLLGEHKEAIILLIAFFPITAVDVVLSIQSGKALKALQSTFSVMAKVYREDKITEIPNRDLVPDDLLIFEEGQTLPADGVMLEAENLSISEAALTGESIPVSKQNGDLFFSGTTILAGRGLGQIQNTGMRSRMGSITHLVSEAEETKSPFRKTVDRLVNQVLAVAFVMVVILFVLEYFRTKQIIQSLVIALTLGMAAVPEEFPIVFTLYLSLGAWRLTKKGVLVKSIPSVESLGGVDVICTDKTGTLTEGVFQLEELKTTEPLPSAWQMALMACEIHVVDSIEIPIVEKGKPYMGSLLDWELVCDYPFDVQKKSMSHVWRNKNTLEYKIAMKGAAEGVIHQCKLEDQNKKEILQTLDTLSGQGKRVLGLAGRTLAGTKSRVEDEADLNFIGFLVFSDPIRPTVKKAIHECQVAGIQIKMLTGDHLLTAHSIADEIGLIHSHEYLYTGDELAKMSMAARTSAYLNGAVFARVTPEQKYEMVKVLKEKGKVVAMTGDGINDAPALKLADIGISMGKSATDVARSTAKMVLVGNDFSGIVAAIFEGRKVFSNLQRSFSYLISFHIPVILLALIPPFLGWPTLLLPIHIILLELVVHPVSAFTFENIVPNKLNKNAQGSLLSRSQFITSSLAGVILSGVALIAFWQNKEFSRSFAVAVVLFGNMFFVLAESLPVFNKRFHFTELTLFLLTVLISTNEFLSTFFHFSPLTITDLGLAFLISSLALLPRLVRRPSVPSTI